MILIFKIINRLFFSALNKRNLFTLILNFIINFSIIFIWLQIFTFANYIPINIRPNIHSKFAFFADAFIFGDHSKELILQLHDYNLTIISLLTSSLFAIFILLLLPLSIYYYIYHYKKINYNIVDWYDYHLHSYNNNNTSQQNKLLKKRILLFPFLLPLCCFFILNLTHLLAFQNDDNFTKSKDLLAWLFYVVLHIMVPILVAIYLYAFHPPGTVMVFALCLGIQNLLSVFTHLLLPMAPPWFTHLYGINDTDHVNYTQKGYAAGLTRVDTHMGTHLNTNGFHKSPIVFGAVPSVHSATAFLCALFLLLRSNPLKNRFTVPNIDFELSDIINNTISNNEREQTLTISNSSNINTPIPKNNNLLKPNDDSDYSNDNLSDNTLTNTQSDIDEEYEADEEDQNIYLDLEANTNCDTDSIKLLSSNNNNNNKYQFIQYYIQDTNKSNKWFLRIFSKGLIPKFLGISFVSIQWWSTMYLDHHYRFDLFIGMLYSFITYLFMNHFVLQPKVMKPFIEIRLGIKKDIYNQGKTMGMRTFKNTGYEWFFDPLA